MSLEKNKALVRRYFEDAPYNPDACDEIFAPSFRFHAIHHATNPTVDCTPESEKAVYEEIKAVWGGWHVTIVEMIAEGDRVMVRWKSRGTHRGEYYGVPPTNKQVTNSGINIFRIADGKIAEVWDLIDRLWMWQQLGFLPETAEFIAQAREAILSQQGGKTE
jgi:predicted ester cyclase